MAITRAEAIDLAVRRTLTLRGIPAGTLVKWIAPDAVRAIRAHFRAICRTYGIKDERYDILWGRPRVAVYDPPEYDGHSLRH